MSEPTINVELTLDETGFLCNTLMRQFFMSGGVAAQPKWAIELYTKLATANDKLMYPDVATDESRSYGPRR
jgi:hypothetical protein